MNTDRIEKKVTLRAPRSRVWRAISDAAEFGAWFGAVFESGFSVGVPARARITTPGYEHVAMELAIERIEPEHLFAFRWHPYDVDPGTDLSAEPTTLVELHLRDAPGGGTELTIVESGFDRVPLARRAEAFRMNDQGWTEQVANIERHVART